MTLEDFDEALLRWGADLARWPEERRAAARRLLETEPRARALREEMTRLDADLGAAMAVERPDGAIAAKVQAALRRRRNPVDLWSLLPLRKILAFGSLAGAGGVALAMVSPVAVNTGGLLAIALGGGLP